MTAPAVVVIRGDRIASAGSTSQIPDGARIIDLGGATLLPGLIDLHTHLTSTGVHWEDELLKTTPGQAALYGAHNALVTLMAGFTTCRDMGPTWPFTDIDLRKAIDEGIVPGPRMLASGNYISPTGGAGDARQFSIFVDVPIVKNLADGPDEVRKAVRTNLKQGADFIKILGTGAVLSKGAPPGGQQYSEEEMHVAVEEAARWGKHVAAHLHGTAGIKAGIRAGVHTIDHGSMMDDEAVQLLRTHHAYFVPTLYTSESIAQKPERPRIREGAVETDHRDEGRLVPAGPQGRSADWLRHRRRRRPARPERTGIRISRPSRPVADRRHPVGDKDGRRDHRVERQRRHDRSRQVCGRDRSGRRPAPRHHGTRAGDVRDEERHRLQT